MLALMPILVILAFRTLCTLRPPPVPTYLKEKDPPGPDPETIDEWWLIRLNGGSSRNDRRR